MNKRLISSLMHKRVHGLKNSGSYFFRGDFEHILRGVALDYTPRGLYIEDFRFPLFDFSGPNLLYSHRLRERPFIGKGEMSEEAVVDFVMSASEVRSALIVEAPMTLTEFVEYIESKLTNPHAKLIHAAALVLLDREPGAAEVLDEIRSSLHPTDVPYWERLRQSLRQGAGAGRKILDEVRQQNLRAFGLT